MGLDMYLTKKHYVKNWNHTPEEKRFNISITQGGKTPTHIDVTKIKHIEEDAGYWRKANHIHNWFVQNVQKGKDDCKEYWVSLDELEELYKACELVLSDNSLAKEILPTTDGFFFGDTGYDEYYFETLKYTREIIHNIMADIDERGNLPYDVYYQSSW